MIRLSSACFACCVCACVWLCQNFDVVLGLGQHHDELVVVLPVLLCGGGGREWGVFISIKKEANVVNE